MFDERGDSDESQFEKEIHEVAKIAFEKAIESGRLSQDPNAENHAGWYMYMATDSNGKDLFKHFETREYLD